MCGFCHADGVASSTAVDLLTDGAAAIWILDHRGGGGLGRPSGRGEKAVSACVVLFFPFDFDVDVNRIGSWKIHLLVTQSHPSSLGPD